MSIQKQVSEDGKCLTISIDGRFDISRYQDFSDTYKDHLGSISEWVLDMGDVDYLDSSALGMLLMLRERTGGDSAAINLTNCRPGVKKIFDTAQFDKLFNIS